MGGLLIILRSLESYKILVKRLVNLDKINILGTYKKIYFCEHNKMGCTRICIFRNVRNTRWMSEICMKNIKKTRWKHDFGVSDLPMTTWTDFVTDTPHLSIIFITMVTCIFLLLEVSAFEIKVKASLAVLVFLMKKQNLGSSTMHIISPDQS